MGQRQLFTYISLAILLLTIPITLVILQQRTQFRGEAEEETVIFPPDQPYFSEDFALPVCGLYVKAVQHTYDEATGTLSITTQFVNTTGSTRKITVRRNSCRCEEANGQYGPDIGYAEKWRMCFGNWPEPLDRTELPLDNDDCATDEKTFTLGPKQFAEDIITATTTPEAADPNCGSFQLDWIIQDITDAEGNEIPGCREEIRETYVPARSAYGLLFTGKDLGGENCELKTEPPVCEIKTTPDPAQGPVGLSVQFDGSGSRDPDAEPGEELTYSWTINTTPPTTSTSQTFTKEFSSAGRYTATLVVTDADGNQSEACSAPVTITEEPSLPPVCKLTATPTEGTAPLTVNFDSRGSSDPDGTLVSWEWNLGDGTAVNQKSLSHTYTQPGVYLVTLRVTDNDNLRSSLCPETITVTENVAYCYNLTCTAKTDLESQGVNLSTLTTCEVGKIGTQPPECSQGVCTPQNTCEGKPIETVQSEDSLCNFDTDCTKPTHLACEGSACVPVDGPGKDLCISDDDCVVTICSQQETCEPVAVSEVQTGDIACREDTDCNIRNVCRNFTCVEERGPGEDECSSDPDCLETYLTCEGFSCVEKIGQKEDTCAEDTDCYRNVCDETNSCTRVAVLEDAPDECSSDLDCQAPTHLSCVGTSCQRVEGAGADQCLTDDDCQRNVCQGEACVTVADLSGQPDQCASDLDCQKPTHLECVGETCTQVSGAGTDLCLTDADCQLPTYQTCMNEACVTVAGTPPEGTQLCETDADCQIPAPPPAGQPTYKTCLNETCVVVAGTPPAGTQLCESDAECRLALPPQREEEIPTTGVEKGALAVTVGAVVLLILGLRLFL